MYAYDQRNRLTELSKNGSKTNFDYDNAGNLLKDDKATYQYNEFNQTTKVETFDNNVQINRYDAEGLRYEMLENDKLVQFIFNQNREVIAEQNEEKWTSYIRDSELIARTTDHARTYYHYASDEMGSITHIVDGKNVLNEYEYDAWGEVVSSVETTTLQGKCENRFKFNGQQLDPITGQYYLRARFYAPSIARFTQEDTYRGDGLNLYAYCDNNPVFYVDPTGMCATYKFFCDEAKERYRNALNSSDNIFTAYIKTFTENQGVEYLFNNNLIDANGKITDEGRKQAINSHIEYKKIECNEEISKYSHLKDHKTVGARKNFTATQKKKILEVNRIMNNGYVKSDKSGDILVQALKSQKGVKPSALEWQFDHIIPRHKGGKNSYSNVQVLSRKENRDKWNN